MLGKPGLHEQRLHGLKMYEMKIGVWVYDNHYTGMGLNRLLTVLCSIKSLISPYSSVTGILIKTAFVVKADYCASLGKTLIDADSILGSSG